MDQASVYVLAMLLTIAGWFADGLTALQDKKFDVAIANLTKVYEQDVPGNTLRELALFYRAQAQEGANAKDQALADYGMVARLTLDARLRGEALAAYGRLGGDVAALLPKDGPLATWNKFRTAVDNGDKKTYLALTGGQMREWVTQMEQVQGAQRNAFFPYAAVGERLGDKDDFGKAWVTMKHQAPHGLGVQMEVEALLDRQSQTWVLMQFRSRRGQGAPARGDVAPGPAEANTAALRRLGTACLAYAADLKALPPDLKALREKGYLPEGQAASWVNPKSGKSHEFFYRAGLKPDLPKPETALLAAAPSPADGKRLVLYADGKAAEIAEDEFQAQAKAQEWVVRPLAEQLGKGRADEIRALIRQLGADNAKDRNAAKAKLGALGAEALPLLEESLDDQDVEIRGSVRELLDQQ